MNPPPIIESPAATSAATSAPDAPSERRGRRVRPAHVLGGALALTAAIMVLGAPAPWPQGHAAPDTVGVGAGGNAFGPADVTVAQGDTVTWQWQGGQHSVTSTSSSEPFDSGAKTAGTFQHTFDKPGTFTYVCVWHSNMQGTVTVTPAAAAPAAPAADPAAPAAPSAAAATPGATASAATSAAAAAAAASPATAGGVPKLARVRLSGPRLLFSLNHPATVVTAAVGRVRATPVGRLDAKPGEGAMVLALNRLRVGRYTLLVGAKNALGRTARTRVRVKVTWALRYRALAMQRAEAAKAKAEAPAPAAAAASVPFIGQAASAAFPPPSAAPAAAPAAAVATPSADPTPPVQCGGSNHSGHGHGSGGPPCEGSSGSSSGGSGGSSGSSGGSDSHGG